MRNEAEISIIVLDNLHAEFSSSSSDAGTEKLPFGNKGRADYGYKRRLHRIVSRAGPREQVDKLPTLRSVYKSDGFQRRETDQAALVKSLLHSLGQSYGTSRMSKRQVDDSLIERILYSSMVGAVGNNFFDPEVPPLKTGMDLLEEKGDRLEPQAGVEYINLNAEFATGGIDDQPIHAKQEKPILLKPGLLA
ncbi:hypothetical protein M514_20474 [Trichuris suis]|uniref:Uncharacterized protein n=1 Tax=Trichuris suis TaxID=68888 RepID=A0A085MQC5_9BILA|nr:hypothetical protein M513_14052 [Trichuris suis]KFD45791.1 hypothetical protein M513_13332 [Trichuris suis]KFD59421.1 hypothetical protein M514_28400 [Trichuris suis]KFD67438.1 hypothetical protein M514_20474 [Trichuris suis]